MQIDQLVCETCRFYDQCYMGMCVGNAEKALIAMTHPEKPRIYIE